jgi:hypothetical protein
MFNVDSSMTKATQRLAESERQEQKEKQDVRSFDYHDKAIIT